MVIDSGSSPSPFPRRYPKLQPTNTRPRPGWLPGNLGAQSHLINITWCPKSPNKHNKSHLVRSHCFRNSKGWGSCVTEIGQRPNTAALVLITKSRTHMWIVWGWSVQILIIISKWSTYRPKASTVVAAQVRSSYQSLLRTCELVRNRNSVPTQPAELESPGLVPWAEDKLSR